MKGSALRWQRAHGARFRRWGSVAALVLMLSLTAAAPAQACATGNVTFGPTGAEQCYAVPSGVTSMQVMVVGGSGGAGQRAEGATIGGGGGLGVVATGIITVSGGQALFIEVGGNGAPGGTSTGGAGGWNGGAGGGAGTAMIGGGGGGGESDVRTCSMTATTCNSLASRVLVAAGGGGGGGGSPLGIGGVGGSQEVGPIGATGTNGGGGHVAGVGGAGGMSALGGSAGKNGGGCLGAKPATGSSLAGGIGGGSQTGGGGGGGGYFGGGGGGGGCASLALVLGGGGGGGAGSSFGPSGTTFAKSANATPGITFFVPPGLRAPSWSNQFHVSRLRTHADGTITFRIKVPGPGRIDALVTAWNSNLARTAALLPPARRRFVFARKHVRARRAGTFRIRIRPGADGRRLIRHHRFPVALRLWITYQPVGGPPRSRGFFALKLPARG